MMTWTDNGAWAVLVVKSLNRGYMDASARVGKDETFEPTTNQQLPFQDQ